MMRRIAWWGPGLGSSTLMMGDCWREEGVSWERVGSECLVGGGGVSVWWEEWGVSVWWGESKSGGGVTKRLKGTEDCERRMTGLMIRI